MTSEVLGSAVSSVKIIFRLNSLAVLINSSKVLAVGSACGSFELYSSAKNENES